MVEKILELFPVAIYDVDKDGKNILLVTVENRHLEVYKLLLKKYDLKNFEYQKLDNTGNNALHYAATYGELHIKP